MPIKVLRQKAEEFIAACLITNEHSDCILQTIEQFRGTARIVNDAFAAGGNDDEASGGAPDKSGVRLSREQLLKELADREEKMRSGADDDGMTDQIRVYERIIQELQSSRPLRIMVQASAGYQRNDCVYVDCTVFALSTLRRILPSHTPVVFLGTGKSFLLTTVYLWCLLHSKKVHALPNMYMAP